MSLPVYEGDAILGIVCQTRTGKTTPACITDKIPVRRSGRASSGDGGKKGNWWSLLYQSILHIPTEALHLITIHFNSTT
jgi:hypothetical protein